MFLSPNSDRRKPDQSLETPWWETYTSSKSDVPSGAACSNFYRNIPNRDKSQVNETILQETLAMEGGRIIPQTVHYCHLKEYQKQGPR